MLLIVANGIFSVMAFSNQQLFDKYKFNPYMVYHRKEWWRVFTGAFLHADWMHLAFNMFALYSFGRVVEGGILRPLFNDTAPLIYLGLYFGGLIFADIYSFEKHKHDVFYNSVGASGAVSAVVFLCIAFFPTAKMGLIFLPIMIPGYIFAVLYLIYSFYAGRKGADNVNHSAHISGSIFGLLYAVIIYRDVVPEFINQIKFSLGM